MCVLCRYVGNTLYNIYNKKACSNIHAHWSVAFAQLVVSAFTFSRPMCPFDLLTEIWS